MQLDLMKNRAPISIRGLTLWQPMAWAISDFSKRIENRPWPPWKGVTHVAIHAGRRYDRDHAAQIREVFGVEVPGPNDLPRGAIVAVARLAGLVEVSEDPWFSGPYGWVLDDVEKLPESIPCKGALGLWRLARPVEGHLADMLAA